MYHIDVKHMLLNSSRLRNFKQKSDHLWNASCPVCGDSASNARRARLYFYRHNNALFVKCHNCQYSTSFSRFLQNQDSVAHKDYTYEKYLARRDTGIVLQDTTVPLEPSPLERFRKPQELSIPSVASLPEGHPARAYIVSRLIPEKHWGELYYAQNYKSFLDLDFPDHGKEDVPEDERIVFPVTNWEGAITYITGRALRANAIRYVTVKILEGERKVYGLNHFSIEDPLNEFYYITEGPIDSLFLPNCLASCDANLLGVADYMYREGYKNPILIFDNQPRNRDIVRQVGMAIDGGFRVVMLPPQEEGKDINDMVKAGMGLGHIENLIRLHAYIGLKAELQFTKWRKV